MKILITGITGFVGSNLRDFLGENYQVIGVGRNSFINFENYGEVEYDVLIHLAGKAHDMQKVVNEQEYYHANYELTKKVFDKFLISNAKTFIFLSSVKAASDGIESVLMEDYLADPKTHYGKSKLKAEQYLLTNVNSGKRVIILRPCMIHGKGNKGNLNLLYKIINRNIPYPLGAFDNKRSYLGIDNFCFLIEQVITNNEIKTGIYNIADGELISTLELVSIIKEVLKKNTLVLKIPKIIVYLLAKLGDILNLPFNSESLKKLTENYIVSNEKILSKINSQLPFTTKEGLLKTLNSFK
jgi:nucleoside-diphosphate-sugar epimerase